MTTQEMLAPFRRAINDYKMIQNGDKIAVGISGGKDSLTLLKLFSAYQRFSPEKFEVVAVHIDMGLDVDLSQKADLQKFVADLGIEFVEEKTNIAQILFEDRKEKNPCSLCSKLRRGALNTKCIELGCNKLALGHHSDDLVETFFLSLIYEGRLSTFAPVAHMSRTNITLIRPLLLCEEKNIRAYSKEFPVLFNPCPKNHFSCREYMKNLIANIQKDIPFAKDRMFSAIKSPERYNLFDKFLTDIQNLNNK